MSKPVDYGDLKSRLGEIFISDDEQGMEWYLKDFEGSYEQVHDVFANWLRTLKKPVPKKLQFGDTSSIDIARKNEVVDDILEAMYD